MPRPDASMDAAATNAEPRSPGKLYALAVVALACFLVAVILVQPPAKGHRAAAVLAYRTPARQLEDLQASLLSEAAFQAVQKRLTADSRSGVEVAPTPDELRSRLTIEVASAETPSEVVISVQYVGNSPQQAAAVVDAWCQQFLAAHQSRPNDQSLKDLALARAGLTDAQHEADLAREKLEVFLVGHFEKLQNGPKLIAAVLQGTQAKARVAAAPPAPNPIRAVAPPLPPAVTREPKPEPAPLAPPVLAAPAPPVVAAQPHPAAPQTLVAAPAPPPVAPSPPPAVAGSVGPRLNPAHAALRQRIADVKRKQEELAATHTWIHPVVRSLVDEQLDLERQLRATPEILPAEVPGSSNPMQPNLHPGGDSVRPSEAVPAPALNPPLGPSRHERGRGGWSIPRTSAPPVAARATTDRVIDPAEQLLAELFTSADFEKYLALQAEYVSWIERGRVALEAERQAVDAIKSASQPVVTLRRPPHDAGRVRGALLPGQLLFWGALAGLAGCLVGFCSGEGGMPATLNRVEDVTERLGLPVVATLQTGDGPTVPAGASAAPVPWVGLVVRAAEVTLALVVVLAVVGIARSNELAGQLTTDPLATIAEACAWWKR